MAQHARLPPHSLVWRTANRLAATARRPDGRPMAEVSLFLNPAHRGHHNILELDRFFVYCEQGEGGHGLGRRLLMRALEEVFVRTKRLSPDRTTFRAWAVAHEGWVGAPPPEAPPPGTDLAPAFARFPDDLRALRRRDLLAGTTVVPNVHPMDASDLAALVRRTEVLERLVAFYEGALGLKARNDGPRGSTARGVVLEAPAADVITRLAEWAAAEGPRPDPPSCACAPAPPSEPRPPPSTTAPS